MGSGVPENSSVLSIFPLNVLQLYWFFSLYVLQEDCPAGRMKNAVKALKSFTFEDIRGIMAEGENPADLDNFDNVNRTRNAVQMTREMTTSNGCHIALMFPPVSRPGVRRKIAEMFVAAMEKGM